LEKDSTRAQAHFLLGVAYQQTGRNDDAIRQLELSVHIDSGRPDPLRALAQSYQRAGRPATEVARLYARALSVQPALAWLRAEYADFLQGEGRYDDAEREYRGALTEQPSLAAGWFNLGTTLAETGRVAASSEAFQEAVHLDPMIAQALSPLLQVRTSGKTVVAVSGVGPSIATLPVRRRAPEAFQLTIAGSNRVAFLNVPPRGFVVVLRPDGTLVRALPTGEGGALRWDLLTEARNPAVRCPPSLCISASYVRHNRKTASSTRPARPACLARDARREIQDSVGCR
jgi:tetratricopeptide (TPR) repeat protein